MKHNLDSGSFHTSKALTLAFIVLFTTVGLSSSVAAATFTVDDTDTSNPDMINSVLLPVSHDFGQSSVTRSYDGGNVTLDADTANADDYAVFYIDNDTDGTVDFQIEMNGYGSGFPTELNLWSYDGTGWTNVQEMQDDSDVSDFEDQYGILIDYEEKKVEIPVDNDASDFQTTSEFKYSVDTTTASYTSGDATWDKTDTSHFSTVYAESASDGDTVQVEPGTYSGDVNVDKVVNLEGPYPGTPGQDSSRGTGEADLTGAVNIRSSYVNVSGLEVSGAGVDANGNGISNLEFESMRFTGSSSDGLAFVNQQSDVEISDTLFESRRAAVYVGSKTEKLKIDNSVFAGNDAGIGGVNGASTVTVTDSTFTQNDEGIGVGDGQIRVKTSVFDGSNSVGVKNYKLGSESTNNVVDATLNYWGQPQGPTDSQVSDNVTYTPWHATSQMMENVQVLDSNGNTRAYSATIQGGVDAAVSGDTVEVESGPYSVSSPIELTTNDLVLKGVGNSKPVIENKVDGYQGAFQLNAPNVTLEGFRIETDASTIDTPVSVLVRADNGTVRQNEVVRTGDDYNAGIQVTGEYSNIQISGNELTGAAIGFGKANNSVIENNKISDTETEGIFTAAGSGQHLVMEGNEVSNQAEGMEAVKFAEAPAVVNGDTEIGQMAWEVLNKNSVDTVEIAGTVYDGSITNIDQNAVYETIQDAVDAAKKTHVREERVWGSGMQPLDGSLKVHVSYEDDNAVFEAWSPSDYAETDPLTFAFDSNADGNADYQIQWNSANNGWKYKAADSSGWASSWSEVPGEFAVSKSGHHYTLEVPVSELGGPDSSYKFGVDSNGQPSNSGGQTFYSTNFERLWYNGDNHHSSDLYVPMEVGEELPATIEVDTGTYDSFNIDKEVVVTAGSEPVVDGKIQLSGEGAVLEGFTVSPSTTYTSDSVVDPYGVRVTAGDVLVEDNVVENITGDGSVSLNGIQVWHAGSERLTDVTLKNNTVRNMENQGVGAAAIKVQGVLNGVSVTGNTVENIHSAGWAWGIVTTHTGNAPSVSPKNVEVTGNTVSEVNDGSEYSVFSDWNSAPYPGSAFGVDGDSWANQSEVHRNSFTDTPIGVQNKDDSSVLDARFNCWGHPTGPSGEGSGLGSAVSENVTYDPWEVCGYTSLDIEISPESFNTNLNGVTTVTVNNSTSMENLNLSSVRLGSYDQMIGFDGATVIRNDTGNFTDDEDLELQLQFDRSGLEVDTSTDTLYLIGNNSNPGVSEPFLGNDSVRVVPPPSPEPEEEESNAGGGGGGTTYLPVEFEWESEGLQVEFQDQTETYSYDAEREWEFGDGETGSGESVSHTYEEPGSYEVSLNLEISNGRSFTETRAVEVSEQEETGSSEEETETGSQPENDQNQDQNQETGQEGEQGNNQPQGPTGLFSSSTSSIGGAFTSIIELIMSILPF